MPAEGLAIIGDRLVLTDDGVPVAEPRLGLGELTHAVARRATTSPTRPGLQPLMREMLMVRRRGLPGLRTPSGEYQGSARRGPSAWTLAVDDHVAAYNRHETQ